MDPERNTIDEVAMEDSFQTTVANARDPTETVIRVLESLPPGESRTVMAPETSSDESIAPTDNQPFQTPETLTDLSVALGNDEAVGVSGVSSNALGTSVDSLVSNKATDSAEVTSDTASGAGLVKASPNVVVERVGAVGTELLSWNLTGVTEEGAQDGAQEGEAKDGSGVFPLDFGDPSAILTQDQILKIDAALKSECQNKSEAGSSTLIQLHQRESAENDAMVDAEGQSGTNPTGESAVEGQSGLDVDGQSGLGETSVDQDTSQDKLQLNTSTDSLNLEGVLDIGTTFNTKDLMNQVMSSDLLMDAIGAQGLVAETAELKATEESSENGSTSDSTPSKKREQKRRSARIAHIEANDITLRQAFREKEQKKKEREEKKKQKKEKKAKEQGGQKGKGAASHDEKPVIDTDLGSEIAKYLQVIDQEIKKSEEMGESPEKKEKETEKEKKKRSKQEEEKGRERANIFENMGSSKNTIATKSAKREDNEELTGKANDEPDSKDAIIKEEASVSSAKENNDSIVAGKVKTDKELKDKSELEPVSDDSNEPGELKEEKEVGELSDHEGMSGQGAVGPWMDHSYAASPKSKAQPTAGPTEEQGKDLVSMRRSSRRGQGGKDTEESQDGKEEEKPSRASRRQSKASKKEKEEENSEKKAKKSGKRLRKKSERDRAEEKRHSRSKSSENRESSVEKGETRSRHKKPKSKDIEKKDRKGDKKGKSEKKEKDEKTKDKRASRHSKDEKVESHATKKSPRKAVKKQKHVDEADLSDIPFSSEEEDGEERDAGEHDSGSEWTSDDDPEKLWCICRKPHDGKFMICCDKCEEWFHGSCVGITKKEGKRMEQEDQSWMCPNCKAGKKKVSEEAAPMAKEDGKKKKKREQEEIKEELKKEKERSKRKEEKGNKEEKKEHEAEEQKKKEGESVKKDKGEKGLEEKRRKRKSDAGHKQADESERKTKRKEKEGDEEDASAPSSKKKRLKFFRPPPPKQHCIGTHCENWARSGSVYCSPACIVKHAKESVRILTAEKERATGIKGRRDSAGGTAGHSGTSKLRDDERISVIERHTGRLRTGLTAPTYEELPYWLGRHPTYEVLKPNTKHTAAFYAGGDKSSSKTKSETKRLSQDGESSKNLSSSDSERKVSTKQITSPTPNRESKRTSDDSLEKRQRERREKVRRLLEIKRREKEAREREAERRWMEENKRRLEEEKREEEERRKKEEEKRRKEEKERRERERKEKEERARLQAESSKLAEQTSESVRVNVKRTLVEVLLTRVKKAGDLKGITADEVKKTAKEIEFELYKLFNDTGAKYKAKYRTLIFNIKDMKNKGLYRHILKGEITPRNLVRMSSEQLASQELMKWREEEAKHELDLIVQTEVENVAKPQHFVKKTHKGEVELGEEDNLGALVPEEPSSSKGRESPTSLLTELKSPTRLVPTTPTSSHSFHLPGSTSPTTPTSLATPTPTPMLLDTTEQHKAHLFDLNCKICTGKVPAPQEEKASKKATIVRRTPKVSATTKTTMKKKKIKKQAKVAEKPVKFFGEEEPEETKQPEKTLNEDLNEDLYDDIMEMGTGGDDDDDDDGNVIISTMEEDVSTTPPGSPEPTVHVAPKPERKARPSQVKRSSSASAIPSTVPESPAWRGFICMHEVSKFVAVAHHVSGPAHTIPLDLQDTLEVCGRIPYAVVWDYFTKLRQSQSTEMTVMYFQVWQPDEEPAFFALFDYFYTRRRIGVIGKNRPHVKDFYLLALPSTEKVPSHILPFDGPGLPTSRPHTLLGIVVRHKDKPRSMSLDSENVARQHSQHREPAPQPAPRKKAPVKVDDIVPPDNPLSSFSSALPNIREMSDLVDPKEASAAMPLRTKEIYVTESQLVDPIVAQYANADPKTLEAELEEPYSPTFEERQAPYDPSDPTDDWMTARRMPSSAVIPEPAPPVSTKPSIEKPSEELGGVQPSDVATAEADASQDVLSAFSDQTELSDQQQLLIQLTKQVEEAKKALLDRQIESLRTEISKATGKLDGTGDQEQSDAAATSPDVRLAPADSSTMTPKDDVPGTPGNPASNETPSEVPALAPPPELPPFAVGAVLWKAAQEKSGAAGTVPQQPGQLLPHSQGQTQQHAEHPSTTQHVQLTHPQAAVAAEAAVSSAAAAALAHVSHQQQWQAPQTAGDFQQHHFPGSHQQAATNIPPGPAGLVQAGANIHLYPQPVGHDQPPKVGTGQLPDPVGHHSHNPHGVHPHGAHPHVPSPEPSHHHQPQSHHHRHHHRQHSHPKEPPAPANMAPTFPPAPVAPGISGGPVIPGAPGSQLAPAAQPAQVTKKRKLEPPPPGVEGWKYGDDEEEPSSIQEDNLPAKSKRQGPEGSTGRHRDWDARRDVDKRGMRHEPSEVRRRSFADSDGQGASWEQDVWHQERREGPRHEGPRHEGPGEWRRRDPPRRASLEREEGYRDWPSRDYDGRNVKIDYGHQKARRPVGDPRLARDYSRDVDYRR